MANQQVHDMTGRTCHFCGVPFKKEGSNSFNLSVPVREDRMIVFRRACLKCSAKKEQER